MELNKKPYLREELEQLSTPQLEEILNTELAKDTLDAEQIRTLTQILNTRHARASKPNTPETLEAWEQYQKDCAAVEKELKAQKRKKVRRYLQRAAVAAALVIACLGLVTIPRASGANHFLDFLTKWSDNVFAIFGPSNADDLDQQEYVFQTDNPGLQQVYDEVTALGITYPVVPARLPEEAKLDELKVTHSPTRTVVHARFVTQNFDVILQYNLYGTDALREYEKLSETEKEIEIAGVTHNIAYNNGEWFAVWTRENLECYISVDCQEDALYEILRSIYTMEDA